jgi:hypothetical protein
MCWYGGGVAPAAPPPICRMHSWEPEPGGERWSVITTGSDGTRANEDPSRPGGSHCCSRAVLAGRSCRPSLNRFMACRIVGAAA